MGALFERYMQYVENYIKSTRCQKCPIPKCKTCPVTQDIEAVRIRCSTEPHLQDIPLKEGLDEWDLVSPKKPERTNVRLLDSFWDMTIKDHVTVEERITQWQNYYAGERDPFLEDGGAERTDHRYLYGYTDLHLAVMKDDWREIRGLLKKGANPQAVDNSGLTPYALALIEKKKKAKKCLEKLGVSK